MNSGKGLLCVLVALVFGAAGLTANLVPESATAAQKPSDGLPLGGPGLKETRTTERISPGVTYTRIVRGQSSKKDFYTVDVTFEEDRGAAEDIAARLEGDGYDPVIAQVTERAPDDPQSGPLGYLVRVGSFATQEGADDLRAGLTADGYTGLRTVYTGEDGGETTGPWVVHVLQVDPDRFGGMLEPELATGIVPDREPLTSISARTDSLAAINGGYFVIGPSDGTPGDLAGISVLEGSPVSEAVDGRTSLVLPKGDGAGADVAAISGDFAATASDGERREIDGLNRKPGLIRACGGDGGDIPTELPKHDFTCTDPSELILFTPDFGASTEPGEGPPRARAARSSGHGRRRRLAPRPRAARHESPDRNPHPGGRRVTRRQDGRRQRRPAPPQRRRTGYHGLPGRLRLPRGPGVLLPLRSQAQPAHDGRGHAGRRPAPRRR